MLLETPCSHAFSEKRLRRLQRLERALFSALSPAADQRFRVQDYARVLAQAGEFADAEEAISDRATRRLLERDLSDYADWCDAFVPTASGEGAGYRIDLDADRDAIRFFLGEAWLDAPLRPRLSSAIARAFLLAKTDGVELSFGYRSIRKAGESWEFRALKGCPVTLVPGSDSAYVRLWNGQDRFQVNLARVSLPVERTGTRLPPMPATMRTSVYLIEFEDIEDARALSQTFQGLSGGGKRLLLQVDAEAAVMTLDRLAAYLWRTRDRPGEQTHLNLPGVSITRLAEHEEPSS
ncbi:hypothetical protein [Thiocystis violacea]|uniref:hypothetical protein n=1 Tax=Thiocystis violacea TaxID=13725 RepID=UPI0019073A45|nr:hypothetical protein [Thiocystis violacea]MBK1717853.1 hypothetical protein [Thiocystis violacea]